MVHYGVTKSAQIAPAPGLAEATTGSRVTVNSVLSDPTRSEGVGRFVEDLAKGRGTDVARVEAGFFRTAPALLGPPQRAAPVQWPPVGQRCGPREARPHDKATCAVSWRPATESICHS